MVNTAPFRPTTAMRSAPRVRPVPVRLMASTPLAEKIVPVVVFGGAILGVISYIAHSLHTQKAEMERSFAKRDNPEAMEYRRQSLLLSSERDPRRSLYNVLGW